MNGVLGGRRRIVFERSAVARLGRGALTSSRQKAAAPKGSSRPHLRRRPRVPSVDRGQSVDRVSGPHQQPRRGKPRRRAGGSPQRQFAATREMIGPFRFSGDLLRRANGRDERRPRKAAFMVRPPRHRAAERANTVVKPFACRRALCRRRGPSSEAAQNCVRSSALPGSFLSSERSIAWARRSSPTTAGNLSINGIFGTIDGCQFRT